MDLRRPNPSEASVWNTFREACLRAGKPDPGPVPEAWPADRAASDALLRQLSEAVIDGRIVPPDLLDHVFRRGSWEYERGRRPEA